MNQNNFQKEKSNSKKFIKLEINIQELRIKEINRKIKKLALLMLKVVIVMLV